MKAEITYNGARSYLVGGVKFVDGATRTVTNPELIERCKNTHGFAVHVLKEKVVREVVAQAHPAAKGPAASVDEEAPPKRKVKTAKSE